MPDASVDPRLLGVLEVIDREHITADPHIEAAAVGLGLAYYRHGRTFLTRAGQRTLREAQDGHDA